MKRTYLIVALVFIISTEKTVAQERKRVVDNSEIQNLLALSKTVQSGEISFVVNQKRKGKQAVEKEEYKVIFSKTGKINQYFEVEYNYNLLSVTDSMQYIYDGKTWYVINHKKKICDIDTNYCKVTCNYPYIYPIVLLNKLLTFYSRELLGGIFLHAVTIEEVQKRENITFLKLETSYQPKKGKKELFTEEYEWDASKSTLFRYAETLKDESGYPQRKVVKTETLLTDASLNEEKYSDAELYNGLNYAKSYKITYSDYKKRR